MPTLIVTNKSPFQTLFFDRFLDYIFLRVLGFACWPSIPPFNKHKMNLRSKQCVYMGYNPDHKGYKCFHLATGRTYISRDLLFNEAQFPFSLLPGPHSTISSSHLPIHQAPIKLLLKPLPLLGPFPSFHNSPHQSRASLHQSHLLNYTRSPSQQLKPPFPLIFSITYFKAHSNSFLVHSFSSLQLRSPCLSFKPCTFITLNF